MKAIEFELNDRSCNFTYFRMREGPNYFLSYYKNSSSLHKDPKECWRAIGVAKHTETGKALKAWCLEMDEKYGKEVDTTAPVPDTSFASEVLKEEEEDPTANTKMVT